MLLQAVSIIGEEAFSFNLSLFEGATEGGGYSDMAQVDGKVTLRLGCIQIVYLHKFLVSLLVSLRLHGFCSMFLLLQLGVSNTAWCKTQMVDFGPVEEMI